MYSMSSVYVHIPYCKTKCNYCDFFSVCIDFHENEFVDALLKEIKLQDKYLKDKIDTIYFGGGTPGLINNKSVNHIIKAIENVFAVNKNPEITIEVNPDDVSLNYLENLRNSGVNRLSIGIQSFNDNHLKFLGRRHNARQCKDAILNSRKAGFNNISIDLICGIPGLSFEQWKQTLREAVSFNVEHISVYILSVEENTPLWHDFHSGKFMLPDDEAIQQQFEYTSVFLQDSGYDHYEISNYAKQGRQSKHNSSYWNGTHYLGLGPSAHSYNGTSRQWNISDINQYIQTIHKQKLLCERETLSEIDNYNEYLITGLRTSQGIDTDVIKNKFAEQHNKQLLTNLQKFIDEGSVNLRKNRLTLSLKGMFISDSIFRNIIVTDNGF